MSAIHPAAPAPLHRRRGGLPLYGQLITRLEELLLASGPLGEETLLPSEWFLVERFGVSRGTLRRAMADLEHRGLVRREPGRGTYVNPAARLRKLVWERLATVAVPDSRFHLDFASFIPDFEGSDRCTAAIRDLAEYQTARTVVVMPDNNLERLRELALADRKRLLVCTFGLARGFVLLDGARVSARDRRMAAMLDGMERFGRPLSLQALRALRRVDLVITGAAAVSREGVHFGKGHGYLDIEWGLLRELGLVEQRTPVVVSVHGCQVVDERVPYAVSDVTVDVIATPTGVTRCERLPKPPGIFWERLPPEFLDRPYISELLEEAATETEDAPVAERERLRRRRAGRPSIGSGDDRH